MCRWLAYSGAPVLMKDVLYEGPNSLVHQSLSSRLGAEPTNGDGFGVGWYGAPDTPGLFHSTEPAWNDRHASTGQRTFDTPSMFLRGARRTIASVPSPRGACRTA